MSFNSLCLAPYPNGIEDQRKQEETRKKPGKKSRWAIVAEEMVQEGLLRGKSEKLLESIRDFRDNFEIPAPADKTAK
jgi:hypothetical protein